MGSMTSARKTTQETIYYVGPSMNPLLKSGDRLVIIPFDSQRIRPGDVVVLVPPGSSSKTIHRVVSVDSRGIKTRGDNCSGVDPWVLGPDQVLGRVVHAERQNLRLRVFGGWMGRLFAASIRAIRAIDSGVSAIIRPAYHRIARAGAFSRWLPIRIKSRVISINRAGGTELQLLVGRSLIGRWMPGKAGWHIRRPFRLFVDEASLPKNPAE